MAKCSMTRMHFQRIAEITGEQIANLDINDVWARRLIDTAVSGLRGTNGSFDSRRFSAECYKQAGLNGWLCDAEKALTD